MPIIDFKEPNEFNYIHIDDRGRVHLIFPIVGGDEIASDNTCKTALELKSFFYGSPGHTSALVQLNEYKAKLEADIAAIKLQKGVGASAYAEILKAKEDRLRQINQYIPMVQSLVENTDIRNDMGGSFPNIPDGVHKLLEKAKNAFAVYLSPQSEDSYTRFKSPAFRVTRSGRHLGTSTTGLGAVLRTELEDATVNKASSQDGVVEAALKEMEKQNIDVSTLVELTGEPTEAQKETFEKVRAILLAELQKINPLVSLATSNYQDTPLTLQFVHASLMPDENTQPEEWVSNIIDSTLSAEFWPKDSSFYSSNGPLKSGVSTAEVNKMSIKVQFFLAEVALFCKTNNISNDDLAKFFNVEENSNAIATIVKTALSKGEPVEDALHKYINDHHADLGMSQKLSKEQQEEINGRFESHYQIIKESPHFDEFFILDPAQKGNVYTHKGRMSCHFLEFYANQVGQDLAAVCTKAGMVDYPSLLESEVSSNHLNHKNPIVDQHHKVKNVNLQAVKLMKDPEGLLAFLLKTPENGVPNIQLLDIANRSKIAYDYNFPELQKLMAASSDPNIHLLESAFNRADLNRSQRMEQGWKQYSTIPLDQVDLQKIGDGLKATVDGYQQKRSVSWWKGSPSEGRKQQMEALSAAQKEMDAVLKADPVDREKMVDAVRKTYAVLDKIDGQISKEWNLFSSTLQQEVRAFKQQLNGICQMQAPLPTGASATETFTKDINARIDSIKDPAIREIVYGLPVQCQTEEIVNFFKQLNPQEAVLYAQYAQASNYSPTVGVKSEVFQEIIPTCLKAINEKALDSVEMDIPLETFEAVSRITSTIPPQHFTANNVVTWGVNVDAVASSKLRELLTEVADINAVMKASGGDYTQEQISRMVYLAQGLENAKRENFRELTALPAAVKETLNAFEARLKLVETEPKDTRALTTSMKTALRGDTHDDTPSEVNKNLSYVLFLKGAR